MKVKKILMVLWPFLLLLSVETLLLFTTVDLAPYSFTFTFLSFFIFVWIQIILHEAGHLVLGWATGYRFLSYRIFSFVIVKENGKLVFKRQAINEAVAQCLMVPHKEWQTTHYPYKLYLSGGILFNAVFSFSALFLLNNEIIPAVQVILFSGIGLFLVFSNAIPKQMNDGAILKKCRGNPAYRQMMYRQLRTIYYLTETRTLKNLPPESFELSKDVSLSDPFSLYVMRLEYYKYLEQFQFDKAANILDKQWQIKEDLTPMDRLMVQAEKLFCLSIQQLSIEEAKRLYHQTEMQLIQKYEQITFKRIFTTYFLYVENDPAKALTWAKAGLLLGNSDIFDNSLQVELNVLEWLQQKAQTKLEQQIVHEERY
ncbi:hypothetical protein JTF06_01475 [Desemzia sp. RIT804]|uniref:hypothetical protein n=1 Tax=Desemzia sp. RIT 804 TaxID=2810209 RepID=UPI00194FA23D|nr:hypothetical protein [Desemzia sp. RIT 804]MBM6613561.1 hypothetical protein [Desemzia sp. RIT 804]